MGLQYTNRRGDVYHLQLGRGRGGKPRCYLSRKITGEPVDAVREGYEIHELPTNAQVVLRKVPQTRILPSECALTEDILRREGCQHFIVDVEKDSIVIYTADVDDEEIERMGRHFEPFGMVASRYREETLRHANYHQMLRFTLSDEKNRAKQRTFWAARWCFLGSIDAWHHLLHKNGPLEELLAALVPHLGKQSFYELM